MMAVDTVPSSPSYGRLFVVWGDPDPGGGRNIVLSACDTAWASGCMAAWAASSADRASFTC